MTDMETVRPDDGINTRGIHSWVSKILIPHLEEAKEIPHILMLVAAASDMKRTKWYASTPPPYTHGEVRQ